MSPTLSKINNESLSPYLSGDLTAENALLKASNTVKDFWFSILEKMTYKMFADLAVTKNMRIITKFHYQFYYLLL